LQLIALFLQTSLLDPSTWALNVVNAAPLTAPAGLPTRETAPAATAARHPESR
jgi:hypothetical protein